MQMLCAVMIAVMCAGGLAVEDEDESDKSQVSTVMSGNLRDPGRRVAVQHGGESEWRVKWRES